MDVVILGCTLTSEMPNGLGIHHNQMGSTPIPQSGDCIKTTFNFKIEFRRWTPSVHGSAKPVLLEYCFELHLVDYGI